MLERRRQKARCTKKPPGETAWFSLEDFNKGEKIKIFIGRKKFIRYAIMHKETSPCEKPKKDKKQT